MRCAVSDRPGLCGPANGFHRSRDRSGGSARVIGALRVAGSPGLPARARPHPMNRVPCDACQFPATYAIKIEPRWDSCDGMAGTFCWDPVIIQAGFRWAGSSPALAALLDERLSARAGPGALNRWGATMGMPSGSARMGMRRRRSSRLSLPSFPAGNGWPWSRRSHKAHWSKAADARDERIRLVRLLAAA